MTLYDMGAEFNTLIGELEQAEDDEQRDELVLRIETLNVSVSEKATAYAKIKANFEAEIQAANTEIRRLKARAEAKAKAVDRMKARIAEVMKLTGARTLETPIGAWSMRKNPPSCVIQDVWQIPAEYIVPQDPKVDSRAILKHFKDTGEIIPGTDIKTGESVQFR